jgi:hypothetical protein
MTRWREGTCTNGDNCKYAHGEADLRTMGAGGRAGPGQQGMGLAGMAGMGMQGEAVEDGWGAGAGLLGRESAPGARAGCCAPRGLRATPCRVLNRAAETRAHAPRAVEARVLT